MTPAIRLHHLGVSLGTWEALIDVSLEFDEGFLALLGPNGAGKSTLVRTILGLVPATSGSVEVMGREPRAIPARDIGYIPQIKTLDRDFPALPVELVASGLRASWPWSVRTDERSKAMAALDRVGMASKAERPLGRLSGGEMQRVYLARALVRQPRLLILDEPATGMDALGEADMYRLLELYRRESGASVFMITHDWEVARHHASHVLLLNRRPVAFGPPKEVLTGDNLRRAYGHMGHSHSMELPLDDHGHHHDHDHGHDHHHD
ncbi:ATP-binding cassette domain-containing protein [bacterium]|nr:ATP-binding cassette domain-containing protein [bacterium]